MRNLAGNEACDCYIGDELKRCGIEAVKVARDDRHHEVPFTLEGRLGGIRLYRAWTYWVVEGPFSRTLADALYADPVGRTDIRVNGDCSCPAPEVYREVSHYHIDSELGLYIFAKAARTADAVVERAEGE